MAKRIIIFNHKGGTGKTLSAYHLGWMLTKMGKKVLLVDGDSQVNLTALSLGFDVFDEYYENPETKKDNIKDGLSIVFESKPQALTPIECPTAANNNNLYVLPGHPDLSEYEAQISLAQETGGSLSALKNIIGAINVFLGVLEERYNIDMTIIDINPGLGALNQNFFLSSDYFIIPTNPDPFSLMAIDTLESNIIKWVEWKNKYYDVFSSSDYKMRKGTPVFLGNISARFNRHASRAARKFDERIKKIDKKIESKFFPAIEKMGLGLEKACYEYAHNKWKEDLSLDNTGIFSLARIPDFQSIVYIAYSNSIPIFDINESILTRSNVVGVVKDNALKNVHLFKNIFRAICNKTIYLTSEECNKKND